MASESRHIGVRIERPATEVYGYASNPANLPEWAPGLGGPVQEVDGRWVVDSAMGPLVVAFAEPNGYGVLDHDVTMPSGETVYNPMRVIADTDGCDVVFTLRRRPDMSDADLARDEQAVAADLSALKQVLERP